ncbi:MAG TPA: nuclear transport factor 2 family protein [Syntrophales bacterium]|nr:nuclear transport factor 2 family protein [Syntrophales bacterium]HOX93721.1 nuclear transport factor 2 family protein [Syntrophales bacterium]HPI57066.1 nuclear transport factor 2 family protein [Syntrophales bacterium]HPN23804.1 nuclear transport factor 2 family protein [Syntrophales bacterium]HQM30125.1 nuclear transport factor 2 family protein [Syntrophales bacterium]
MKGKVSIGLLLVSMIALTGCAGGKPMTLENYTKELAATDPARTALVKSGSAEEKAGVNNFKDYYRVFSGDVIRRDTKKLYAKDAFFKDGYKEVKGVDAIEAYFTATTKAIVSCTFEITDVGVHEGNYYFRWVMKLTLKRDRENPIEQIGMSHVRFGPDGKVIFHADCWDTSVVFERAPLIGSIIRWAKEQF